MKLRTQKINYSETCATAPAAESYSTKYDRYFHKRLSNQTERALLDRIFDRVGPVERLVDVPSGPGRISDVIAKRAEQVYQLDYSLEMLKILRDSVTTYKPRLGRATAFHLPFRDAAFDLAVSIRLNHHIPDHDGRLWHIRELFRVSRGHVLVTFFDSGSLKSRVRELRRKLGSSKRGKFTLSRGEVIALAEENGFEAVGFWRLSTLFSGHSFALLRRPEDSPKWQG